MVTNEEVEKFRQLYEAEFGEKLTKQGAHDRAVEVIALFEVLVQEPPGKEEGPKNKKTRD